MPRRRATRLLLPLALIAALSVTLVHAQRSPRLEPQVPTYNLEPAASRARAAGEFTFVRLQCRPNQTHFLV